MQYSETSDKGHSKRGQASNQRTNQMYHCIQTLYKITSERGQPLYRGQIPKHVHIERFRCSYSITHTDTHRHTHRHTHSRTRTHMHCTFNLMPAHAGQFCLTQAKISAKITARLMQYYIPFGKAYVHNECTNDIVHSLHNVVIVRPKEGM